MSARFIGSSHRRVRVELVGRGQVDVQRADRHPAVGDRMEVGTGSVVARSAGLADPVDRLAARIGRGNDGFGVVALAESRHLGRADFVVRAVRDVHVQQHRLRPGTRDEALDDAAGQPCRAVHMRVPLLDQREGDRRNAEQEALHRRGDGAGIDRVVAHVRAVVDAGDDQVRTLLQQPGDRHMDAIRGRAIDEVKPASRLAHRQWPAQGQRIRRARPVTFRRVDRDFREIGQDRGERLDARGEVAVVVADQDAHGRILSNRADQPSAGQSRM